MPLFRKATAGISAPLAVVQYAPVALATYTVNGGLAALDAANLTASFIVPASGKVIVTFEASMNTSGAVNFYIGLLPHGGGAQIGHAVCVAINAPAGEGLHTARFYLSGLAPGPLQVDIAGAVNTGSGFVFAQANDSAHFGVGNRGPALIVVSAA